MSFFQVQLQPKVRFKKIFSSADHIALLTESGEIYSVGGQPAGQQEGMVDYTLRCGEGGRRGSLLCWVYFAKFCENNRFLTIIWTYVLLYLTPPSTHVKTRHELVQETIHRGVGVPTPLVI